jgi:hypothetical protein
MKTEQPEILNYFGTREIVVTASKAQRLGLSPNVHYGYYAVLCWPDGAYGRRAGKPVVGGLQIAAWCRTKAIAVSHTQRHEESKQKGYFGCPCGTSSVQARACPCGWWAKGKQRPKE